MDGRFHFSGPERGEGVAETEKFIYNKTRYAPVNFLTAQPGVRTAGRNGPAPVTGGKTRKSVCMKTE